MTRREVIQSLSVTVVSCAAFVGLRRDGYGYVDVERAEQNDWIPAVVLLDGVNVSDDVRALDDRRGFVDLFVRDEQGKLQLNEARDGVAIERRYGHVQFFPKGQHT